MFIFIFRVFICDEIVNVILKYLVVCVYVTSLADFHT